MNPLGPCHSSGAPKVLLCSPLLSYPGHFARNTLERARAMASVGMDVTVFGFPPVLSAEMQGSECIAYVSAGSLTSAGVRGRLDRSARRLGKGWIVIVENLLTQVLALRYARRNGFPIVCINDVEPWIILILTLYGLGWRAPRVAGTLPYAYHMGSSLGVKPPWYGLCRHLINHALAPYLPLVMHVFCGNEFMAGAYRFKRRARVHVIPEGYSRVEDAGGKAPARARLTLPPDRRLLLFIGVANPNRGAQVLCRALANVQPSFDLCVAGEVGRLFRSAAASQGNLKDWENHVHIRDHFLADDELASYYTACDAVVLPHRFPFMVSSGNMRDAIRFGKALIASDQYELGQVVKSHALGLTFEPDNAADLARCLNEFAAKPEVWFREIEVRSKRVVEQSSWEGVGAIYKKTVETIVTHAKDNA